MTLFVLVCLAICFLVGPILSGTLTYLDIRNLLRAEAQISEYDYRWETITGIVFSIGSIGLGVAGLVAIATTPYSTGMYSWLDAETQLVRMLQVFVSPPWVIWAVHLVAVLTVLDIVSAVTSKTISSAYESALLARFAAASLISSALSRKQLEAYKNSGSERRDEGYVRLLCTFVLTNAAAASVQLCGAITISTLSLAGRSTSTQLRQGIFIACTAPQLLCHLPFYVNRIWRRLIVPITSQIRRLRHWSARVLSGNDNF
ncbi:hypothetical protein EJ07DRAFT_135196 [Lizonia empirigonia]|nr:hypothetical protein EJ07DRAFT_135196 [Lizonia empirigonia]